MDRPIPLNLAFDFVNQHKQILPREKFILLSFIRLLGNDYDGQVCMSTAKISNLTGFDQRSVQCYVAKLKLRNVIEIENTFIGDGEFSGPNKYRIVGWPEWVEAHV